MRGALPSLACGRKIYRCPPFQKAAVQQKANRSSAAEGFPPHSQFLAKFLTSAPINFYLRAAEIRVEVLHCLGSFLGLLARCVRRLQLHGDVSISTVA